MYQPTLAHAALGTARLLSCDEAVTLVRSELRRLGLQLTHRVAILHSAPDLTAEGAPFAAIVLPRSGSAPGLKLLVAADGHVSQRAWPEPGARRRRPRHK